MTKAARVDKLYNKLTPEELAGLAFEASICGGDAEYDAILASVGNRIYICRDQRFSLTLNAYIDLGMFYGMTYWQNRTYMACADNDNALLLVDHAIAMDVALQAVCAKANVDVMAVKKMALCLDEASFSDSDKPELVKEYYGLFMNLLKSSGRTNKGLDVAGDHNGNQQSPLGDAIIAARARVEAAQENKTA